MQLVVVSFPRNISSFACNNDAELRFIVEELVKYQKWRRQRAIDDSNRINSSQNVLKNSWITRWGGKGEEANLIECDGDGDLSLSTRGSEFWGIFSENLMIFYRKIAIFYVKISIVSQPHQIARFKSFLSSYWISIRNFYTFSQPHALECETSHHEQEILVFYVVCTRASIIQCAEFNATWANHSNLCDCLLASH